MSDHTYATTTKAGRPVLVSAGWHPERRTLWLSVEALDEDDAAGAPLRLYQAGEPDSALPDPGVPDLRAQLRQLGLTWPKALLANLRDEQARGRGHASVRYPDPRAEG